MKKASLTVVGAGIKFLSQMTVEANLYIEKSELLLYLVNNPALKQWIMKKNRNSKSLDDIYFNYENRLDAYNAITDYILDCLFQNKHVCVVLYGHPSVFAKPALDAVIKAKSIGYNAKILPGISAEDCLFADLLIDPGTCGCQSFDATDFILYSRKFDTNSHLILWQPDVIGERGHVSTYNKNGVIVLFNYLKQFYPLTHPIVLYEAAQYPGLKPIINNMQLNELSDAALSTICTLYISPANKSKRNEEYAKFLSIS